MNRFIVNGIISLLVLSVPLAMAADHHDHGGNDEKEHGHQHAGGGHDGDEEHSDHHNHEDGPIQLSEESQELGGIKTAQAGLSEVASKISVSGRIAQDVEEVKYVTSPESATVEECRAALGSRVKQGEVLCTVVLDSNGEKGDIKAPINGTVISEFVKKGEDVDETSAIYAIADLNKLPANFDIYEKDIASVKLGQKMLVYPLTHPDKSFKAEIVFISPRVDETTYTVKIRAVVDNTNDALKLGMSVRGEILSEGGGITVPAAAVQTVENKTVVFMKTDKGFVPQEVKIGAQTNGFTSIEEGICDHDEIVVEGAFILKSKMMEDEMGHDHAH